eukprot:CAMPEP_0206823530 /NCGR_PEP_ID=MMETSP0975-20121206/13372_1 /ASSEMBLY_ACC=CAM_ASM_000399 /TAXON_ID=483370 /ORGANISM="non described non described, Strain CCMP2097" /LENGTH=64 /DNA_ID=CAMNT_0054365789 /DNA_START=31 /DNA_END=221 /DNA_ORIENTATION=-
MTCASALPSSTIVRASGSGAATLHPTWRMAFGRTGSACRTSICWRMPCKSSWSSIRRMRVHRLR